MIKKCLKATILIFSLLFILTIMPTIKAETYMEYTAKIISNEEVNIMKESSSTSEIIDKLSIDTIIKYKSTDIYLTEEESCKEWIYLIDKEGYICKALTEVTNEVEIEVEPEPKPEKETEGSIIAKMTDEEFDKYLSDQGFDEIYKTKLKEIHKKHPNWVFKAVKTNRDWNSTVDEESQIGYSTYYIDAIRESAGHEAYLSTESHYNWETNMFKGYDGNFFLANKQTVQYFLDPRNYLNEVNIFMFESLYFNKDYQTKDKVTSLLGTSQYTDYIYNAGEANNYSPIAVAIKIRQEGTLNKRPTLGTVSVKCNSSFLYDPDNKNATLYLGPLYNFFNIGAYTRPTDADLNGLCYAAKTDESLFLPWNTPEKAINGGVKWIAEQYLKKGQYTNYFQKFNVANPNTEIWHQYMTNIEDPKSQSSILYNTYSKNNLLDSEFVFYIPIFNDMPNETNLPKLGNPNNWLTSLNIKVNDVTTSVSNFKGDVTEYTLNVPNYVDSLTINATTVAKTSYVSVDENNKVLKTNSKQVALQEKESTFKIIVTAGNGNTNTYTLKIIKDDAPLEQPTVTEIIEKSEFKVNESYISGITFGMGSSTMIEKLLEVNKFANIQITNNEGEVKTTGALGTGDRITITSNNETKTYEIVLYGDVNGDGEITLVDIVAIQKHLWKDSALKNSYSIAADATRDEEITLVDIVAIQKHLWKDATISQ